MNNIKKFVALFSAIILSACATAPESKDFTTFISADPHSILIVPVINHSEEVEAADLFLTTLPVPLSEKGYYVFPTNMVKKIMEEDGLGDPLLVHSADTTRLADLFGADSIIYVEILEWTNKYNVLSAGVQVHFLYTIKDGHDGKLLWQDEQNLIVDKSQGGSGNIFADLIATAIVAASDSLSSDYTYVANSANANAIYAPGQGIPAGPYSALYKSDTKQFPASGTGRISDASVLATSYQADPNVNMKDKEEKGDEKSEESNSSEDSDQNNSN
ncbi:MAG: DUF799 family lipoprotein [Alphaproteobacteria bacterium]|nr:DUF799 family lipoprotein [Alphaproteobacteria bacterium]HPF45490.1 DUF799 family lipoprotein [Emcibacteraceae bacterium]